MTSFGPIVRAVSLILRGLYTCCCWLGWHFWHTHQTREDVSQTPLHTDSRKHVFQPGNHSKTLGLNVPQVKTGPKSHMKSNQIKSLLSEIIESVLQTVQKQFTYRQYILTDLYRRQCAEYTNRYSVHTVYCKTCSYQYTLPYVHILHYVHIHTVICEGATAYT